MTKTTIIAKNKEHLEKLIEEAMQVDGHFCDLNYIDVSQVTDMSELFHSLEFNGDISRWDVSNVLNMRDMFKNSLFDGDISAWNVANVHNMICMFINSKFNGNLSKWNIANVKDMWGMFQGSDFNRDIGAWDVSNVLDMGYMFRESRFNGDLSHWSFKNDVMITNFFDPDKLDQFEMPNMYHWLLILEGSVTRNAQWRAHVDAHTPIVRSFATTKIDAARLMHRAWLSQEPTCETALSVPFESLEMP